MDRAAGCRGVRRRPCEDRGSTVERGRAADGRRGPGAPPGCYFEHHVKLALPDETEMAAVRALAERHTAHVSRNARRDLGDRGHERFVTQRCRGVGRTEARRRLDALLDALATAGFKAVEVEEEFVVHDDHPALDSGWIDEKTDVR